MKKDSDSSYISKPRTSRPMTKDRIMQRTLIGLGILAIIAIVAFGWTDVTAGITIVVMEVIGVLVALITDYVFSRATKNKERNTYSAVVSGLIAALSFSSGIPQYYGGEQIPTMEPMIQYVAVAVISVVSVILFKRIQSFLGRKYVNPVAAAKLLVLAPIWNTALIPTDHILNNIRSGLGLQGALILCYSDSAPFRDPLLTLTVLKNHGWLGGASSIAVIAVGLGLLILCRRYLKWRIPITFLVTTAVVSFSYGLINGEDVILRTSYHLFIGSVIFLAFFMATDPPTTPLTDRGQMIFAVGLGVLTFGLQIWGELLGGSILALVIMNLTVPVLDRVGIHKPREWVTVNMVPLDRVGMYAPARKITHCIRCGRCIKACPIGLYPIMISEAIDKENPKRARELHYDACIGCGICSYECPSGIPLANKIQKFKATT